MSTRLKPNSPMRLRKPTNPHLSSKKSSNKKRVCIRIAVGTINTVLFQVMEANSLHQDNDDDEEYVLLDLDGVSEHLHIPPDAPYVLSGLDTLNPVLTIGDNLKLIGQYEETIGTCIVFTEDDALPVVHEETGPSEANLFAGKCIIDPNQGPRKQVKPMASLQKTLKFRLSPDADIHDAGTKPANV
ncbi:TFIIIC_sub6 domain-containing protein [Cephalotus follicularis]|uniref:TFIIIC_sub6 domain-containing protein n=1 Tax=Cephalotus follicularis TaxID=3775 RepID=A0A1Q3D3D2_CEPFO|nr:TFIIIC_sub6 domain-containing protein [Cephalotus follicularis]